MRDGLIQTHTQRRRLILQGLDAARPNTAGRKIHDPQKRSVIVQIFHQPEVGQGMLDFRTFKKSQPTEYTISNARIK